MIDRLVNIGPWLPAIAIIVFGIQEIRILRLKRKLDLASEMLGKSEAGIARANGVIRSLERRLTHSDRIVDQQAKAIRESRRPSLPRTEDAPWPSPRTPSGGRVVPLGSVIGEQPSSSLDDIALGAVTGAIIASESGSSSGSSGSSGGDSGGSCGGGE